MQVKKLAILLAAASLATALLTGCPWDKDDAASSDLPGSSGRPDYDGAGDDENTGKPGGEEDNPGEGGEGDEGETGQPQEGYDEVTNTYTVASEDDLREFAAMVNGGTTNVNCTLAGNITLTGDWTPIGNNTNPYTGRFDGQGYTISGLKIDKPDTNYVGLFGYTGKNGTVQNLNLEIESISGDAYVGGIAGWNDGTITGCVVSGGSVEGSGSNAYVGGVAGRNKGTITGCVVSGGNVSGGVRAKIGGVVGDNYGTIAGCMVSGGVSGQTYVGGVVGYNPSFGIVTGCCFAGDSVSGGTDADIGGVVGLNAGTVTDCYWQAGKDGSPDKGIGHDFTNKGRTTPVISSWEEHEELKDLGFVIKDGIPVPVAIANQGKSAAAAGLRIDNPVARFVLGL